MDTSKPVVLVQDATEPVGLAVMRALMKYTDTYKIRAGVQDPTKAGSVTAHGQDVEVILVDTQYPQTTQTAFHGVSKLVLCPANTADMVESTKLVIQAAADSKSTKHVALISLLNADKGTSPLQAQYHEIEQFLEHCRVAYTVFRCSPLMETLLPLSSEVLKGNLQLPTQTSSGSIISATDVAECVAAVLNSQSAEHERKYYNITGPEGLDGDMMALSLEKGLGFPVRFSAGSASNGLSGNDVFNDSEILLGRKPSTLSQWVFDNRHQFVGQELRQREATQPLQEKHVRYVLPAGSTLSAGELAQQDTNEQGQHTTNEQGQQGSAHARTDEFNAPVACYQKTSFPHLSGHTNWWYENCYPLHQERKAQNLV